MLSPGLHIKFFNKKIHSFHFFGVLGYVLGILLGVSLCYFLDLRISIILLMGLVGAATFFLLAFAAKIITGDETIVYYHHEIAILIFCSITLYLLHYPVLQYIDITLLGIGAFLAFGRIGCFNVGCCHGRPGNFGYRYGAHHVADGFTWYYKDVILFPVQLIESAFVFCIVITGSILLFQNTLPGTVLILYTVVYGAFRFAIEFFRGDAERPYWKGLSEGQWTTLLLIGLSLGLSFTGHLPFYNWHLVFFLLLVSVSLYVVFAQRKTIKYRLLRARHIEELATGLQHMKLTENNLLRESEDAINIYSTTEGLSISSGRFNAKNKSLRHYTISSDSNLLLDAISVKKIGNMISLIKKHNPHFEMIEKENGVYHLIFYEELFKQEHILEPMDEN